MPLRFEAAFPQKAVPAEGFRAKKQWEAALEALVWLRTNLDEARRKEQPLLVLGNGDFSVAELRAALPEEGGGADEPLRQEPGALRAANRSTRAGGGTARQKA